MKKDEKKGIRTPEEELEIGVPEQASLEEAPSLAVETLQRELDLARSKANEYLDGWQRSRAEFTNYKKRVDRELQQAYQTAAGSVIRDFLSIVDDLERALKNPPVEGDGAAWAAGIELIHRKLLTIMKNEGVAPIQAEGAPFDPNFHEAVASDESGEHESGQVIEVLQQGYMLGDKVLRPARVRVAR
ncbi:MAG: nucleotide exchange factor GrpE [Anaerolineae bacterium]|jgi:molecular chaperone GrpE|nr:nucleotide exchange factor GrpE [Anaerolineae bacterium]MCZ7552625.1 nucleotide exchange factor GrpE [Anaerolineales bacterium]